MRLSRIAKDACTLLSKRTYGQLLFSTAHELKLKHALTPSMNFRQVRWFGQPSSQTHPHLLQDGDVTPGISKEEYRTRRLRLIEAITNQHPNSVVILPSSPAVYMSHDIPYPFRQNTDFLYLTGFLEPNSILVLQTASSSHGEHSLSTLFVPKKEPLRELWDGPRSGADGAVQLTGVDQAFDVEHFDAYMADFFVKARDSVIMWYDQHKLAHPAYHAKHIGRLLGTLNVRVESPRQIVQMLRLVKSSAEIALMKRSCEIASEAFIETMKFSSTGMQESHLNARMEFECRIRGAERLAYPSVVAGGNRANIIHYVNNDQLIGDNELVLMDAGCEYHGYSSDITRTWPVSGYFTPCQRELYEALLEVQELCIARCSEGDKTLTMERLYFEMLSLIGRQLQRLRIVDAYANELQLSGAGRQFCPHHVGHYLGMDVHDTDEIPRSIPLVPGMIVTVEPGIYIPASCLDVPAELRGIGLRIEDDILITDSSAENLCLTCPKYPDQLELIKRSS